MEIIKLAIFSYELFSQFCIGNANYCFKKLHQARNGEETTKKTLLKQERTRVLHQVESKVSSYRKDNTHQTTFIEDV